MCDLLFYYQPFGRESAKETVQDVSESFPRGMFVQVVQYESLVQLPSLSFRLHLKLTTRGGIVPSQILFVLFGYIATYSTIETNIYNNANEVMRGDE